MCVSNAGGGCSGGVILIITICVYLLQQALIVPTQNL